MKKFLGILFALATLPAVMVAQTYTAQSGVSLFTMQLATATATSGPVRLPTFSGTGNISITGSGITGSPSGCTIALAYEQNNATTATSAVATISFTPGNSVQQAVVAPSTSTGDNYVATYACASTYPTAGYISVSFSPALTSAIVSGSVSITATGDVCNNPSIAKSSVAVNISTATTTQLVAISGTKVVYACSFAASVVGTSPTVLFEYGTGSACGTGTTALSGTLAIATGSYVTMGWGGTIVATPAGNALCLVSGGTGPSVQGILTYVSQ